jgi:hypothetical protein
MNAKASTTLTDIASQVLGVQTLEARNSDSLDFHDLAIWNIKQALEAAYLAGQNSVKERTK